mmetsp:Transcript_4583/g.15239  ORF Transcript_4583/g.15239 Transcript_4583/m.15239 type:complete len:808 (-) Transcript_4583:272-2695(-)
MQCRQLRDLEQAKAIVELEAQELQRQRSHLTTKIKEVQVDNECATRPTLSSHTHELSGLRELLRQVEESLQRDSRRKSTMTESVALLSREKDEFLLGTVDFKEGHHKAMTEPNRVRKQSDCVLKAVSKLQHELQKLAAKKSTCDRTLLNNNLTFKDAAQLCDGLLQKVVLHRHAVVRRRAKADAVWGNLGLVSSQTHELSAVSLHLRLLLNDVNRRSRIAKQCLTRARASCHITKRMVLRKRAAVAAIAQVIPPLGTQDTDCKEKFHRFQKTNASDANRNNIIRQEVDLTVGRLFLHENKLQTDMELLECVGCQVAQVENELGLWTVERRRQDKLLSVLTTQQDVSTREAIRIRKAGTLMMSDIALRDLDVLDLTKSLIELRSRCREFSALYEAVKNERTKYIALCQSLSQALGEVKEKLRILADEILVLRNESSAKEQALALEMSQHLSCQSRRDCLRLELFQCQAKYRGQQKLIEQHSIVIQKLNANINYTEQEVMRFKGLYESAIELRDRSGATLIDRNDELCVFYEKVNIQDQSIQHAERRLRGKMGDLKLLRCYISKAQNASREHMHNALTYCSHLKAVAYLRSQLVAEQDTSALLCLRLERPSEAGRWRTLSKEDPESSVVERLELLNRHLNFSLGDFVEGGLVLEELLHVVASLQRSAVSESRVFARCARKVHGIRSALSKEASCLRAAVTELAMYRAASLRLRDIRALLYMRSTSTSCAEQHSSKNQDCLPSGPWTAKLVQSYTRSIGCNTLQRPNAYIPDASEVGIPLPYGSLAPFKPSKAGACPSHRHLPRIGIIGL